MKTVKSLPWIECNLTITKLEDAKDEKTFIKINNAKLEAIKLIANQEYEFSFSFSRKGKDEGVAVQSSRYPKRKDESWFIIIGKSDDELVTVKRASLKKRTNVILKIVAPSIRGSSSFMFYLMSDSYLGLDQQYELPLHVISE